MKRCMQYVLGLWLVLILTCQLLPAKEEPVAGQSWIDPVTGIEFVWIPEGEFLMGCGSSVMGCLHREEPAHTVRVNGFWLGKYEVTQTQWQKVMGNNPSYFEGENLPVEQVTWDDVQEFIKTLNETASQKGKYRLPTEAEWEYAARAGTQTEYGFGNDAEKLGDYAWYADNSGDQTHPVGQKQPNAWGLYDMHGNVGEWCQDWFDSEYYAQSPAENPQGPASGSRRIKRGGAWPSPAVHCRSVNRANNRPDDRRRAIGFRLVKMPE